LAISVHAPLTSALCSHSEHNRSMDTPLIEQYSSTACLTISVSSFVYLPVFNVV
jgi:hypothetical protein